MTSSFAEAEEHAKLNLRTLQMMRQPVIFVVGGPGSGKATQCQQLAKKFGLHHISMGQAVKDMFKKTQNVESNMLQATYDRGGMIPLKETIYILQSAMIKLIKKEQKPFLIHGFPRYVLQAVQYEREVGFPRTVILLDAEDAVTRKRLEERSTNSRRPDDQPAAVETRLHWHRNCHAEIITYYEPHNKLYIVDANRTVNAVYKDMAQVVELWI